MMGGQIVDATLVSAPRRRNTERENEAITRRRWRHGSEL